MDPRRRQPLVLAAVAATLGLGLIGGAVGTAQDASQTNGAACPEASPAASLGASPVASPPASLGASPVASPTPCPTGSPDAGAGAMTVTIESVDIDFIPAEVRIPANTDVTVRLPNNGQIPHNFTIDELDINVTFQAGESPEVVINAPPGTYYYFCNIPGHAPAGMDGNLVVE